MTSIDTTSTALPLEGKVAIVTGSGRGIGAATAIHLAELGADVVVNYLHNSEPAGAVRDLIIGLGRRAVAIGADAGTNEGAESLAAAALAEFGRLDILVSNAGPLFRPIPLADMTWDDFSSVVVQDLSATFHSTKAVLPTMIASGSGRIIYIGSASAHNVTPGLAHHGSSRAALEAFGAYVAKEMGPHGITANVVSPGMVLTDRTAKATTTTDAIGARTPAGRIATPEDVARVVGFFASDAAGFYTGVNFTADGGMTAGR